jgi:hypothetical protein
MARPEIGGNVVPTCQLLALVPCSPPAAAVAAISKNQWAQPHIEYYRRTLSRQLRCPSRRCQLPFPCVQACALICNSLVLLIS